MRKRLHAHDLALLKEVVSRHCPHLIETLDALPSRPLTALERDGIREGLLDEFTTSGLNDDFEPNERGKRLDALIDTVWHSAEEDD